MDTLDLSCTLVTAMLSSMYYIDSASMTIDQLDSATPDDWFEHGISEELTSALDMVRSIKGAYRIIHQDDVVLYGYN